MPQVHHYSVVQESQVGSWGFHHWTGPSPLWCQWRPCGQPGHLPSSSTSSHLPLWWCQRRPSGKLELPLPLSSNDTAPTAMSVRPCGKPDSHPCPAVMRTSSPSVVCQWRPSGGHILLPLWVSNDSFPCYTVSEKSRRFKHDPESHNVTWKCTYFNKKWLVTQRTRKK